MIEVFKFSLKSLGKRRNEFRIFNVFMTRQEDGKILAVFISKDIGDFVDVVGYGSKLHQPN